jgi:hypothetical protein
VAIFWRTKEAMNIYRKTLLAFGFGSCFPGLKEEYDPDRRKLTSGASSRPWESESTAVNNTRKW